MTSPLERGADAEPDCRECKPPPPGRSDASWQLNYHSAGGGEREGVALQLFAHARDSH